MKYQKKVGYFAYCTSIWCLHCSKSIGISPRSLAREKLGVPALPYSANYATISSLIHNE